MKRKNDASVPNKLKRRESPTYSSFAFGVLLLTLSVLFFSGCNESERSADNEKTIIPIPGINESQQSDWRVVLINEVSGSQQFSMRLVKHGSEQLILEGVRKLGDNLVMSHPKVLLNVKQDERLPDNHYSGFLKEDNQNAGDIILEKYNSLCYSGTASGSYAFAYAQGAGCGPKL